MSAVIVSLQVGKPASADRPWDGDKAWTTGFHKRPVDGPIRLRRLNFDGDGQADLTHHGGPDKAVCVYPAEHYPLWQGELSLPLLLGAFAENLTVGGLTEDDVCIGDVWEVGDATTQVSQPRQPCWKLARWWNIRGLALRVQQTGRTGWYLRVLSEGDVASGATLKLIERSHPEWSVATANRIMHDDKHNIDGAARLAAIPELSESWQKTLKRRIDGHSEIPANRRLDGAQGP